MSREIQVETKIVKSIEHPTVDQVTFIFRLKPGQTVEGQDSFMLEDCLLHVVADHMKPWVKYLRDTGSKTL